MQLFGIKIVSAKHYNELELRIRNINESLAELSTCVSDLMELEETRRKKKFSPKQRVEYYQTVSAKFHSLASNIDRLRQDAK